MSFRRVGLARVRLGLELGAPVDAVLEIRIRYWLVKIGRLIEARDTPRSGQCCPTPQSRPGVRDDVPAGDHGQPTNAVSAASDAGPR